MNRQVKRAVERTLNKKSKAKLKVAKLPDPPVQNVELPEDLNNQWGACRATATAFECLKNGAFQHNNMAAVEQSLGFLKHLYHQSLEVVLKHPQADLVPELRSELAARKAQSEKDPKTNN